MLGLRYNFTQGHRKIAVIRTKGKIRTWTQVFWSQVKPIKISSVTSALEKRLLWAPRFFTSLPFSGISPDYIHPPSSSSYFTKGEMEVQSFEKQFSKAAGIGVRTKEFPWLMSESQPLLSSPGLPAPRYSPPYLALSKLCGSLGNWPQFWPPRQVVPEKPGPLLPTPAARPPTLNERHSHYQATCLFSAAQASFSCRHKTPNTCLLLLDTTGCSPLFSWNFRRELKWKRAAVKLAFSWCTARSMS